ncbi:MAG: hypothetical protein KGY43_05390 [Halodesulfurarchaeum sp.]|nr:hypothetical protein [Halodesulfurarchaeum sp.]
MPFKDDETTVEPEIVDRFDGGFGWFAHPGETMQRASHAIDFGDGVWIVDPVDAPGIDAEIEALGEVKGVAVLLDRHERDAAAFARRFDVPLSHPPYVDREFDAPTEMLGATLPGEDVEVIRTLSWPGWSEAALYDGQTLLTADVLGNASYFTAGPERIGVHPMVRLSPPQNLRRVNPDRILVGHGPGIDEHATRALDRALNGARRRLPQAWVAGLKSLF